MTGRQLLALPRAEQAAYWNAASRAQNTAFLGEVANSDPGVLAYDFGIGPSTAARLRAVGGDLLNSRGGAA